MNKMFGRLLRRVLAALPAVLFQLVWLIILLQWLAPYSAVINTVLTLFAFFFVLYIMSNRNESTYKILWLLVILGLPVAGAVLYLTLGNKRTARPLKRKLEKARAELPPMPLSFPILPLEQEGEPLRTEETLRAIEKQTGYPLLPCEDARYYPLGELMWKDMLADLETAEHTIFAEYFILENGLMWDSLVDIFARKAAEGVDVRVLYDDLGSIATYSRANAAELEKRGIRCIAFNPLKFIRGTINYRDHRKMLVIDGRVAYSGGVNMADEYINRYEKHGHWKDIGFRITGAPVVSYTRMFTEFWNAFSGDPIPEKIPEPEPADGTQGYLLSYYDSPIRSDAVTNNLYVELLSQATRYAWFFTPYLMLGDTLLDAFIRAAKRGVDVRILMPGIPDKKLVYRMSRSYYAALLEAGVKIYEYTPGFVHAKACLVDDLIGTVGTVNLDYRSLFLHFENNTLFYRVPMLRDLKADFLATQEKSRERTVENIGKGFWKWFIDGILRVFAPLC